MQGPNGTGKSDRQRPGDSNTKKQAPHVRQARANKDIIPPQASGYTLASYPHAHVTRFHSHFSFQRCERQRTREAQQVIERLTGIRRGLTQVRVFLKKNSAWDGGK